jgi:aminopeptidase N
VAIVGVALVASAMPAVAQGARSKPRLKVGALSKPPAREVLKGERISLDARIRNSGKRAGRSPVKLIIPDEPGSIRGRKLDLVPKRRFKRKGTREVRLRFEIDGRLVPAKSEPRAEHPLAGCVRRRGTGSPWRCKEAKRPLVVGRKPLPPAFKPGGRSAGDPLFPQTGNTGYDALAYEIDLNYNPATNRLLAGTRTRVKARATQNLGRFSLDFQDLEVATVKVDGREAAFEQVRATPRLEGGTQPRKLVVTPPQGIPDGTEFDVAVRYSGNPVAMIDPDGSSEGWVRACLGVPSPLTCDGALVVNEPNGAQGWFPGNNHPSDKATFRTSITVPSTHVALGIGELAGRDLLAHGRERWRWVEDHPTATYLTTATVGEFTYTEGNLRETIAARTLPVYTAIDADATPLQRNSINASLARTESMVNFLAAAYGTDYPFDSAGAMVDQVPLLGYALEVQTKPAFSSLSVNVNTLLHEYSHQWFGNSVSPATWLEIWFNEGWAEWSTWYWDHAANSDPRSPAAIFADLYDGASASDWRIPPATLDGDPANLFAYFPVYQRSAMTLEGYRQIVGHATFREFAKELNARYGYGNVTTAQVVGLAKELSGFSGAKLALLGDYFQQWLYGRIKPTILPAAF